MHPASAHFFFSPTQGNFSARTQTSWQEQPFALHPAVEHFFPMPPQSGFSPGRKEGQGHPSFEQAQRSGLRVLVIRPQTDLEVFVPSEEMTVTGFAPPQASGVLQRHPSPPQLQPFAFLQTRLWSFPSSVNPPQANVSEAQRVSSQLHHSPLQPDVRQDLTF